MKLSVIIPAFNAERLLPGYLEHLADAMRANASPSWSAEVIVCDNNSTDRTPQVARAAGARVVFDPLNQVSRTRNAVTRAASGDWLLILDADSSLHPATLANLLRRIASGRCSLAPPTAIVSACSVSSYCWSCRARMSPACRGSLPAGTARRASSRRVGMPTSCARG